MPWRVEDALKERDANYVMGGRFKAFCVRDGQRCDGHRFHWGVIAFDRSRSSPRRKPVHDSRGDIEDVRSIFERRRRKADGSSLAWTS